MNKRQRTLQARVRALRGQSYRLDITTMRSRLYSRRADIVERELKRITAETHARKAAQ